MPGATIIYDVKSTRNLKPWIATHGGVPLLWKTGHSLIKAKMKEIGAALAGEMSGHTFFGERWYGFDDGLYAGARLLEILSRHANPSAVLDALPDALSTPELNVACAEGEQHALIARARRDARRSPARATSSASTGCASSTPDGFGLARASNTTPVVVLRFEADDDGGARAHPGRVPARARRGEAGRRAAVLSRWPRSPVTLADIEAARERIARRHLRIALRRVDPAVAAHRRAHLLQARLPAAHRQLQGARRAQRAAAAARRAAQARRDRRVGRQSRAGHRLSRAACSAFR